MITTKQTLKTEYTINEISSLLSISTSTLKYWESVIGLSIGRNSKNARRYTEKDIIQLKEIKNLVVNGKNLNELKALLNQPSTADNHQEEKSKVQVIYENKEKLVNDNFDLIIKPFSERLSKLEKINLDLVEKNEKLNRDLGRVEGELNKYNEILSFKDILINDKDKQLTELRERLSKIESHKWWKFWK